MSKPYVVERHDEEDGSISYEIWDTRQETFRRLCRLSEVDAEVEANDRGEARRDAYLICNALNAFKGEGK
jgi:hypothetical protein